MVQLSNVLACDMTWILLYDAVSEKLKLQAVSHEVLWDESNQRALEQYGQKSLSSGNILWENEMNSGPFKSIMCIPLILKNQVIH